MTFLALLLPCLLITCALVTTWVFKLWGKSLVVPGFLSGPVLLILYFYSGIRVGDSEALPQLRQLFLDRVLQQPLVIVSLCAALALALAVALYCGICSETLKFTPDTATEFEISETVYKNGQSREKLIGIASPETPLIRRFFSGTRRLTFKAEGFDPKDHLFEIQRSWLSSHERRIPVILPLKPEFGLLDFHSHEGNYFNYEAAELGLPERLSRLSSATLLLTLAVVNKRQIRIQNLRLVVEEVNPFEKTTFPVEGLGGDGDPPILGHAELSPEPGTYEIIVNKMRFEEGASPQDYRLLALSRSGFRYRVRVLLQWTDMRDPRRGGEHLFEPTQQLEFPNIIPWENMTRGASSLRVFYELCGDHLWVLQSIAEQMKGEETDPSQPPPRYIAAMCSASGGSSDPLDRADRNEKLQKLKELGFEEVAFVEERQVTEFDGLVGKTYGRTSNFMVIDDHTMLIQDSQALDKADILKDKKRIEAIIRLFDALLVPENR